MKGLILAAGKGTRLYPITKNIPKPLIKLDNMSTIEHSIATLINDGIKDIGVVINPEYEELFRKQLKKFELNDAKITYIYQRVQMGIAHAVLCAKDYINGDNFILLLGDNLILGTLSGIVEGLSSGSDCVLTSMEDNNPSDYGVIEFDHYNYVKSVEEKPINPKSNWIISGAYGFNHTIFNAIKFIELSERGEFEITDAINVLLKEGRKVTCCKLITHDIGTHERLEEARNMLKTK